MSSPSPKNNGGRGGSVATRNQETSRHDVKFKFHIFLPHRFFFRERTASRRRAFGFKPSIKFPYFSCTDAAALYGNIVNDARPLEYKKFRPSLSFSPVSLDPIKFILTSSFNSRHCSNVTTTSARKKNISNADFPQFLPAKEGRRRPGNCRREISGNVLPWRKNAGKNYVA